MPARTWFGSRSLRGKMTLVSVAVSLAVTALLSIAIVVAMRFTFRRHLAAEVSTTAHLIAENAGAALLFSDAEDAGALLGALRANRSVLSGGLYGRDGRPLATYHRDQDVVRVPGQAPPAAFLQMSWDEIETSAEVIVEGADVGRIFLRADLAEMHRFTAKIAGFLVLALAAAGVLAWALSSRLQRVIVRPVDDLARTAVDVTTSKNYSLRARKYSEDELGALTDSFNEMLETIQDRDRARRESEEKYRALVENAGDAILVTQDGLITFANSRAIRLLGLDGEKFTGTPWAELVHPEDRALLQERHRARLAGEDVVEMASFRIVQRHGDIRWVQMNSVSIVWEGQPAVLNFARDVTEQVRLEGHLRQAQKMEAIGTLAGGIAHDFNNILAIMIGYSELAQLKIPKGAPAADNLQQVLCAGERASRLVAQILTFSRKGDDRPGPCDLGPVVKETLKFLRATLPPTIEIVEHVAPTGQVVADPTQIHQVVMNLCMNAFHAMEERGGVLEVALAEVLVDMAGTAQTGLEPGGYAMLSVGDTGVGIAPELRERIFEPYFTTKEDGKGTGLGLAVVHGIVTKAGGQVKLSSEANVGTTFRVYLPLIPAEAPAARSEPTAAAPGGTERILVVDDEPLVVQVIREALESLGYAVTATTDSAVALTLFRERPESFDLVVTDLRMPKLNGEALVRELRAVRSTTPVILCTGFNERLTEERLRELGVTEVLMKPVSRAVLAAAIRRAIEGDGGSGDMAGVN